jgi:hypothetical protein
MKIVVSRFNESIEWTKQLDNVLIYNKGDTLTNTHSIQLDNVGREGHTFYKYIYDNYDNLDDLTVFLQANPFDHCHNVIQQIKSLTETTHFMFLSDRILDITISFCNHHHGIPLLNVYKHLFQDNYIDTPIQFGTGGQFAVSKKLILSQPRSLYLQIVKLLDKSSNPIEGFVIERFHKIILDKKYKQRQELINHT